MSLKCFKAPSLYGKNQHRDSQLKSPRTLVLLILLKAKAKKDKVNKQILEV